MVLDPAEPEPEAAVVEDVPVQQVGQTEAEDDIERTRAERRAARAERHAARKEEKRKRRRSEGDDDDHYADDDDDDDDD